MKKRNYPFAIFTIFLCVFAFSTHVAEANDGWSVKYQTPKVFIENKGQFHTNDPNEKVLYAFDNGSTMISFSSKGVTYSFLKRWKKEETENERVREHEALKNGRSHAEMEAEEHRMEFKTDVINFIWENANPNVEIVPLDETFDYYSYSIKEKDGTERNINHINAFKKLVYKNIYPNIDIEYVFHPTEGIKYSLIVHPGGDISKVKMKYDDKVKLKGNGDLHIPTLFGDIVEHAPVTFYSENRSNIISSLFVKTANTISFKLGEYDHTKKVIIDPWVQTPTLSNSNSVWECERDAAGNVYIIGGDTPMKIIKYNAAGILQWTYNTTWDTANYWLGTFAVDLAGNSYVTSGTQSKISKVNTAGGNVWTNNSIGGNSEELWNITFNCDQTRLIIGGTSGIFPLRGAIFDLDVNSGNVLATKVVGFDKALLFGAVGPDEVRSICSAPNGKYYFLILDSIGRISQNFTACSSTSSMYKISSTYDFAYYNPSYRYSNSGIMAIKANKNFLYTQNGNTLHKRALGSLAIISSVTIPGGISVAGVFGNPGQVPGSSGLDIDTCGNVYVGSSTGVYKYDANLTQIGFAALPFTVFDVTVSTAGNIIVAGSTTQTSGVRTGYVQSIASFAACNPLSLFCCDASVCTVAAMCITGSPVALAPSIAGGTWSGAGVNPSTGVFNPATAGVGTHTIIYTLPCGSDSISIVVSTCEALTACQEINGDITATSGTPAYTWYNQTTTQNCSACAFGCAFPPGCAVNVTSWVSFTTGTTVTPSGTYPILFIDGNGDSLQITSLSSLPNCSEVCPQLTVTSSNIVHNACLGQSIGSFNASTSGGVSPWDYTLVNGGGATVITFTNVTGIQSFTGLPAGTYTLNVLDSNNCPGSTIVTITQPPTTTTIAAAGPDQSVCSNSTVLAGNFPIVGTGVWTLVSGTGTITTPTSEISGITGLGIGINVFEWTISNAPCSAPTSDQVTITNSGGGPVVTISSQTNVSCYAGNNGSATASVTGGSGSLTYLWTASGGNAATAINLMAGTYTITVTDSIGCVGIETVEISQSDSITAMVNTTPTPCGLSNGSANVIASGGSGNLTYLWNNGGATTQTITNIGAGLYLVTITDSLGCTTTASGTVLVNGGGPTATITSQSNASCFGGNNGYATAFATGGIGAYTYSWNTSPAQLNDTVLGLLAGTYICLITDSAGCQTSVPATISQPSDLNINTGSVNSNCAQPDGQGIVTAANATAPYLYLWNTSPTQTNDTATGLIAGTYQCIITDANNCKDTVLVTIVDNPAGIVNAGEDQSIVAGDSVQLIASAGLNYVWTPASDLSCTNCQSPFASPSITTTYYVTVTDSNGCSDFDSVKVTVTEKEYYSIPNVFSPNNDGFNDFFELKAEGFKAYRAEIFDRWGIKMFETNDSNIYWNGNNKKGKTVSGGVYFYILYLTNSKDQVQTFKGFLTVVR
ncbi:MAG: gliding motility-associated C-terminal domain-containing protein [Bacteroidota bacterium]